MYYINLRKSYKIEAEDVRLALVYEYAESNSCTVKAKISPRRFLNINVKANTEIAFLYYYMGKEFSYIRKWVVASNMEIDVMEEIKNLGIEIHPASTDDWNKCKYSDRTGFAEITSNGYIWWDYKQNSNPPTWFINAHGFRDNTTLTDAHFELLRMRIECQWEPDLVIDHIKRAMERGSTKKRFLNRLYDLEPKIDAQIIY